MPDVPGAGMGSKVREPVGVEELRWQVDDLSGDLERPIVAVAYRGLFDASGAATAAVTWMADRFDAAVVGDVDPESFFDFTQERPVVEFNDDGDRRLRWPSNDVLVAHGGDAPRDLVLMSGVEPHLRWRTFAETLVQVVAHTGAESVVTLGAMAGMAPHTRPLGVVASSTNPRLAERLGLDRPSYQGPTGLIGVLHNTLDRADIPVISLRVSVPHYVPDTPNPKATRSLLRRFEQVTGVKTGYADLDESAAEWQRHVDAAVNVDTEISEYVRRLESDADESEEMLPSGDDLAAEFEAFLREQDRPSGGSDQT
ncbi:MAG: PAC2 family protein [Actinomycetota bacterium]|nr:PAC2 family protein [Actinomycetota bacterium]